MKLAAAELCVGYGEHTVIDQVTLQIDPTQITVIIGPNGSGKSTLLSALSGQLRPRAGEVTLDDKPIGDWPRRKLARALAVLPQQPMAPDDIQVRQMVAHGRFAHSRAFRPLSHEDHAQISRALELTGTLKYADRLVSSLSGGQRQRVWIALALAQTPGILLLDEPTSFLDVGFQYRILDLLTRLNRKERIGVVMVLHDINQASFYADRIIALESGRVIADGSPEQTVVPEIVSRLYGLEMRGYSSRQLGRPFCLPSSL